MGDAAKCKDCRLRNWKVTSEPVVTAHRQFRRPAPPSVSSASSAAADGPLIPKPNGEETDTCDGGAPLTPKLKGGSGGGIALPGPNEVVVAPPPTAELKGCQSSDLLRRNNQGAEGSAAGVCRISMCDSPSAHAPNQRRHLDCI